MPWRYRARAESDPRRAPIGTAGRQYHNAADNTRAGITSAVRVDLPRPGTVILYCDMSGLLDRGPRVQWLRRTGTPTPERGDHNG